MVSWPIVLLARVGQFLFVVSKSKFHLTTNPMNRFIRLLNVILFMFICTCGLAQCGSLPIGVTDTDIGDPGAGPGIACKNGDIYTLQASGTGMSGTQDGFFFIHVPHAGDVDVFARVPDIPKEKNAWTGVTIRKSLADDAPNVSYLVNGKKLTKLTTRTTASATTVTVSTKATARRQKSWLRLSLSNSLVLAYYSQNGTVWDYVGHASFDGVGGYYVGLATTTTDTDSTYNYQVDNFTVNSVAYRQPTEVDQVTVAPNPVGDYVQIAFPRLQAPTQIQIVNTLGQIVFRTVEDTGTTRLRITMNHLSSGVYYLRINQSPNPITRKLVKI